ncbi:hypothetical protein MRX96_051328 [Rhipicephalus microplus]
MGVNPEGHAVGKLTTERLIIDGTTSHAVLQRIADCITRFGRQALTKQKKLPPWSNTRGTVFKTSDSEGLHFTWQQREQRKLVPHTPVFDYFS